MVDNELGESHYQGNPPFDPKSIHIETKPIPLEAIVRRIQQGTILLAPDFQRKQIWDVTKKSLPMRMDNGVLSMGSKG